jgi:DNA-binding XRE family transcriptional regulator
MPGKWLGEVQVKKYKELRKQHSQETAANKMGISVRTARRLEKRDELPSHVLLIVAKSSPCFLAMAKR